MNTGPIWPARPRGQGAPLWPYDLAFIICAALYAWLAFHGIVPISGNGAVIDSDLMTYAQGMAGADRPEMFTLDPALHSKSAANSIPNIERLLADWLAPPGQWAVGLLAAGAVSIFVFYAAWYALGRWLYGRPAQAALLAILSGVTVWVGWGTFWGVSHSDPIPRVFFSALMPILLYLGISAMTRQFLRPAAMFCAGLMMWTHGVSALNCGAMLFMAFLLNPASQKSWSAHIANLLLCLAAFFTPVLIFLWPSLFQSQKFSAEELTMFQEFMQVRWHEDYADFAKRLWHFFSPHGQVFPILAGGLAGWLLCMAKGPAKAKIFCRMCPGFVMALLLVAAFCWAESHFAYVMGRIPMGHELVRGLRMLVPVSWMLIVAGLGCFSGTWLMRGWLVIALCLICAISADRQFMAAQYAISQITGLDMPLAAKGAGAARKAAEFRDFILDAGKIVPEGELVYCPEDMMPVRYMALRPLAHSFKDGYAHFYNKDAEASKKWLELESLARQHAQGWQKAWPASGARWLILRASMLPHVFDARIMLEKDGWILARRE